MDQDEFGQFEINNFFKYNDLKKIIKENGDLNYYKATLNLNSKILKVRIYPYNKLLAPEIEFINQIQQYYQEYEQSQDKQNNQCYFAKIYDYFEEEEQQYLVFENSGKDLQTEIKNNIQYYQDKYKIQICKDITKAVEFLHKKQTIARTLKPQDFVRIGQTYKLINFSYIRDSIQFGRNKGQRPNEYSAPEFLFKHQKNYYELDVWSLGMIFYEIFQGNPLIEQQNLLQLNEISFQEYIKNTLNKLQIKDEIKQLLIKMLNIDRNQRPKIDEIIKTLELLNNKPVQQLILSFNQNQEPKEILKLEKIIDNTDSMAYKTKIQNHFFNKDIRIKFLSKNNQVENEFLNQLFKNCNQHSYMIKILDKFNWNDQQIVVTEFGQQDLLTYLQQNNNLSTEKRKEICLSITLQIYYIHNINYVHGDLRMENIYFTNSTFKIIEFQKIIKLNQQQQEQISFIEPNLYISPELIENNNIITKESDIWSLGCIWYEIFSGQILFDGQNIQEIQQKILNHKNDQKPIYNKIDSLEIDKELKEIIKWMLYPDYEQRIDVVNLLKMFQIPQPNIFPFNIKNCLVEKIFQNAKQILPIYQQLSADQLIQNIQLNIQNTVGNESIEKIKNWNKIYQKLCQYIQEITKDLNKQIEERNKNLLYFQYPNSILLFPKLNFCQQGVNKNNI